MKLLKFSKNLREIMTIRKITQQELANKIGTTQATVNRWIKGVNEPDLNTLLEICLLLDITPNEILGYDDIEINNNINNSFNKINHINNNSGTINIR